MGWAAALRRSDSAPDDGNDRQHHPRPHRGPGLRLAVGIGEAPIGLQGTFSLWDSPAALNDFAHRREPHVDAIRRTATEGWYAEELFARFEVLSVDGEFAGRPV